MSTRVKLPPRPANPGPHDPWPVKYRLFAKAMADRGYRPYKIQAAFTELGIKPPPSLDAIRRWSDPDYARDRARKRNGYSGSEPKHTWRRRLDRMRELRAIGLSYPAVGRVMNHDFGLQLSTDTKGNQVQRILTGKLSERNVERLLTGGQTQRRLDRRADA